MSQWVEISFDCLPLRSVGRLDVPLDASPNFRALCERVKAAIETHGAHNTYYLYNARCAFHLTNNAQIGMLDYRFEGVAFTDEADMTTRRCDLAVRLERETCDWLVEPVARWFAESVTRAVQAEFDLYIQAGDLRKTKERIAKMQAESDQQGGYVGMYL